MKISEKDIFIVGAGRSVATAKRGMAHEGGEITLADISQEDPESLLNSWIKSEKIIPSPANARRLEDEKVLEAARIKAADKAEKAKEEAAKVAAEKDKQANTDKLAAEKEISDSAGSLAKIMILLNPDKVKSEKDILDLIESLGEQPGDLIGDDVLKLADSYASEAKRLGISFDYAVMKVGKKNSLRNLDDVKSFKEFVRGLDDAFGIYVQPRVRA